MKKLLKRFCVFLLFSIILVGCGKKDSGSAVWSEFEKDSEYVMDKGMLVVGVTDFEPLDYKQGEEWVGFDAEMAQLFGESLGVSVEFQEIEWAQKETLLKEGEIDCVWNGMTLSSESQQEMSCSSAYLNNAQVVVVPSKNALKMQTEDDCMHLLFAVESGSAGEEELKKRSYRYTAVESQMAALESVVSGKADAAVIDLILACSLVDKGNKYADLTYTVSLNKEEYGIGFRKESDLAEKVNAFLEDSYGEGEMKEIAEKYGIEGALTGVK